MDKEEVKYALRGQKGHDLSWLPISAATSMAISLLYLIVRAQLVLLAGGSDLIIWTVFWIEVAIAGNDRISPHMLSRWAAN